MRAFPVDDGFNRKGRHTVLVVATYRVSTPTDLDIDQLVPFYSSGSSALDVPVLLLPPVRTDDPSADSIKMPAGAPM